ncbi:hypothetical protein Tco_1152405 [Tanacetum coccineum]
MDCSLPHTVDEIKASVQELVLKDSVQHTNRATSPIHPFGGENAVRIIPGPAGILQAAKLRKTTEIREGGHECVMPTHEYVRKIIEDASEDDHFTRGPWLSVIQYLDAEWGITSGCFGDIKTFCKNEKLENVVTLIKSCTSNALGELRVKHIKDHVGMTEYSLYISSQSTYKGSY